MSKTSRVLFAIAALLLAGAYVLPLWSIHLIAPQYPEGLGMEIHISSVHGIQPNDLDNINELNHYIGMKRIEPASIPELKIMPMVLAGVVLVGLLVAGVGRRALAWSWVAAVGVLGAVAIVDFYKWEYDYGHHLDVARAIIKIPGMSYQPPLIGIRQLLNFTASSWPGPGAFLIGVSIGLALVALLWVGRGEEEFARRATGVGERGMAPAHG